MDFIMNILAKINAVFLATGLMTFIASFIYGGIAFLGGGMAVVAVVEKIKEFFSF